MVMVMVMPMVMLPMSKSAYHSQLTKMKKLFSIYIMDAEIDERDALILVLIWELEERVNTCCDVRNRLLSLLVAKKSTASSEIFSSVIEHIEMLESMQCMIQRKHHTGDEPVDPDALIYVLIESVAHFDIKIQRYKPSTNGSFTVQIISVLNETKKLIQNLTAQVSRDYTKKE
jgi:hypothetical protein